MNLSAVPLTTALTTVADPGMYWKVIFWEVGGGGFVVISSRLTVAVCSWRGGALACVWDGERQREGGRTTSWEECRDREGGLQIYENAHIGKMEAGARRQDQNNKRTTHLLLDVSQSIQFYLWRVR